MKCKDLNLIRQSKAQYCRFVDSKEWEAFGRLLVPDAKVRIVDPAGATIAAFDRSADFVRSAMDFIGAGQSIHQIHNEEFEPISDDEVSAIWSMEDYIVFPNAHPGALTSVHGYGHYFETWRKNRDKWQITSLELKRSILEMSHGSESK
jgi:hypothetical protein